MCVVMWTKRHQTAETISDYIIYVDTFRKRALLTQGKDHDWVRCYCVPPLQRGRCLWALGGIFTRIYCRTQSTGAVSSQPRARWKLDRQLRRLSI